MSDRIETLAQGLARPLDFFSENVDRWGAAEWFDRMAKALRQQDAAVVAGDMMTMETCRNVAASSAMRLVREFEPQVRAALAAAPTQGVDAVEATENYSFGTDYGKDILMDINQMIHRGGTHALAQDCLKRCHREIRRLTKIASRSPAATSNPKDFLSNLSLAKGQFSNRPACSFPEMAASTPAEPNFSDPIANGIMGAARLVTHDHETAYRITSYAMETIGADLEQLRSQVEETEALFELQAEADRRAVIAWKEAHPDRPLMSPDRCDMVIWLMEEFAKVRAERDHLAGLVESAVRQQRQWLKELEYEVLLRVPRRLSVKRYLTDTIKERIASLSEGSK